MILHLLLSRDGPHKKNLHYFLHNYKTICKKLESCKFRHYIKYWISLFFLGFKANNMECTYHNGFADCSHLNLTSVPSSLPNSTKHLDISHNRIHTLRNRSFEYLVSLMTLDLSHNEMNYIAAEAFKGLTNLTSLSLNNNGLKVNEISGSVFRNMKGVKMLTIDSNLYTVWKNIFVEIIKNLPELYQIELDVVPNYEFEVEFVHLKHLSVLLIHAKSFEGFYYRKRTFKHLPLTQITKLDLYDVHKIDNDTFSNLTDLQYLMIRMGNVVGQQTISKVFQSLDVFRDKNITDLDINSNTFDQSFRLDGSHLQYVQRICLKSFKLRSMYITGIDGYAFITFATQSKCLEKLELLDNIIFEPKMTILLFNCLFHNLRYLRYYDNNKGDKGTNQTLDVKYSLNNACMQTRQKFGNFMIIITIASTLTDLVIKDSILLDNLDGFSFGGGKNLQILEMKMNLINCLFQIDGAENLKYLDMTGWRCKTISGHLLSKVPLLETLIAARTSLGDGLKNNADVAFLLQNNLKLQHVDLTYNKISYLPNSLFMHQFPNLTNVNISHNYLSNFPSFGSNTKPEIIDLSFNSITHLNDKELEIIDYMKPSKIYLDGNPLQCSCRSLQFLKWMKKSDIIADVDVLRCIREDGSSQNVVDFFWNLELFESECLSKFWLPFSVTLSSVITICIIFTAVYVRYKRVFEYLVLIIRMYCRSRSTITRREYDAFVSYSHDDLTWVVELHDELTSMGFDICLHDKTFIPGTPIGENIIQAIDSSRKVIFIITKNFLKSDWGSYELEMTRMHAFRRGNDNMVIVVIKGDVPMSSLPRVLLSMWYKVRSVEWPNESCLPFETEEYFYRHLKHYLTED